MTAGSLLQLIGAIGAVLFMILKVWIRGLPLEVPAVFMAAHFAGDVIEKLFVLPDSSKLALEFRQYVKLRAFLLFVGLALAFGGIAFGHVHGFWLYVAFFGFFVALIGAFTYNEIYT